jgi:hypothetical protein
MHIAKADRRQRLHAEEEEVNELRGRVFAIGLSPIT